MAKNKSKKLVLITGGTSGIGLGIAINYLKKGYGVVINYFNDYKRSEDVKKHLVGLGFYFNSDFFIVKADIGDEGNFNNKIRVIKNKYKDIEILINNAGILKRGNFLNLTQKDWLSVFNVNVFGIINISKWFAKTCKNAKTIINIGSIRGMPHASRTENMIYSVRKSTVPTITAVLAKTLGPKIRVNAIIPGTIDTPQRQGLTRRAKNLWG
ncbi:MAG: SDR family NAD(P)-dependent oxidoreductase [Patescibacteria group bacterium]